MSLRNMDSLHTPVGIPQGSCFSNISYTGDMRGWTLAPNLAEILPDIVQTGRRFGPTDITAEMLHMG